MLVFELIGDQLSPLGWSLYHFLGQGMLVAALYSLACLIWGTDVRRRYGLACFFLAIALLLPAWQVWMILNRHHGLGLGIGPPESLLLWMTWAALLWLCLAVALSVGTVVRAEELTRMWVADGFEDTQLNETAQCVAKQVGLEKAPHVLRSRTVEVMAVIGWVRPTVVVPMAMLDCLTDAQFRALLAHEMAHVSRGDPLVTFTLSVLECLVFFHPAAAWLAGEVRGLREYCCDDIAAQVSGDALVFARGLMVMARMPGLRTRAALSANGGDLKTRVVRLVSKESLAARALSDGRRFILWLAGAATLVAAAKVLCRLM